MSKLCMLIGLECTMFASFIPCFILCFKCVHVLCSCPFCVCYSYFLLLLFRLPDFSSNDIKYYIVHWIPHFFILNSILLRLDSTFWLDSTLKLNCAVIAML